MKRYFYLVTTIVRRALDLSETEFVERVFPLSDVKEHLANKLLTYKNRNDNHILAILDFYEGLDQAHQFEFDSWLNDEMRTLDARTVQCSDITPTNWF